MKWKFDGDDIVIYFEKNRPGHLWIGLGETMTDADIFRIEKINSGNDITVQDCFVSGHVTPSCTETD